MKKKHCIVEIRYWIFIPVYNVCRSPPPANYVPKIGRVDGEQGTARRSKQAKHRAAKMRKMYGLDKVCLSYLNQIIETIRGRPLIIGGGGGAFFFKKNFFLGHSIFVFFFFFFDFLRSLFGFYGSNFFCLFLDTLCSLFFFCMPPNEFFFLICTMPPP